MVENRSLPILPPSALIAESSVRVGAMSADIESAKLRGAFLRRREQPSKFMLRIRLTGGELSADQARQVAMLAYDFGHGFIDVTRRGDLQVQGVESAKLPKALQRLEEAGLSGRQTGSRSIRTVVHHPLSGFLADDVVDTGPLCEALTDHLLAEPAFIDLPAKCNIALSGRPKHDLSLWTQDLAFLAYATQEGVLYRILAGGCHGERPRPAQLLPFAATAEEVPRIAHAAISLWKEVAATLPSTESLGRGRRVRFADVIEHLGLEKVAEAICGTSPIESPSSSIDITTNDFLGWTPLKETGRWALGVNAAMGRWTWQQLEGIALAAKRWGDGTLRTAPSQAILILQIGDSVRDALAAELGRYSLNVHADSISRHISSCTGRQFCDLGVAETKGQALKLVEQLRQRLLMLHGIRIQISGCSAGCAQHRLADIGLKGVRIKRLIGVREGFDVYVGGGVGDGVELGRPYRMGVVPEELADIVCELVRDFYLRHLPGQTFSSYWRTRLDVPNPARTSPGRQWECADCGYLHSGYDPPIFCPKCASLAKRFARMETAEDAARPRTEETLIESAPIDEENLAAIESLVSVHSLVDWLRNRKSPEGRSSKSQRPRGRPRDPSVLERDKLIRHRARQYPHLTHKELAHLVTDELSEAVTAHMVRNAIKRGPKA